MKYSPGSSQNSLNSKSISKIYLDKQKRIWLGTLDQGINLYDPLFRKFNHLQKIQNKNTGLKHNAITSFLQFDNQTLWIGTDGGGITVWNRNTNNYSYFEYDPNNPNSLSSNAILDIFRDSKNNIWIATRNGGINKFDAEKQHFIHYLYQENDPNSILGNHIFDLTEDQHGNIWCAVFQQGISIFNPTSNKFQNLHYQPNSDEFLINSILIDSKNQNWVGTHKGLQKITLSNDSTFQIKYYNNDPNIPSSLSAEFVNQIYEDSKKRIWVCTIERLNLLMSDGESFRNFGTDDGLSNENIKGITEDSEGNFWISTNKGISKMIEVKNGQFQFENYDKSDGLQGNEFIAGACYQSPEGEVSLVVVMASIISSHKI